MVDVNDTLAERGRRYGSFESHSAITQAMKDAARKTSGWEGLLPPHKEALEMIFHKIGRILNGDPNYADSWHDIAGYARLVETIVGGGATPGVVAAPVVTEAKAEVNLPPFRQAPPPLPTVPAAVPAAPEAQSTAAPARAAVKIPEAPPA